MKQPNLNDLVKQLETLETKQPTIRNSGKAPEGSWTEKIVAEVRVSDLAAEHGIDCCPECGYDLDFDDNRGWFICIKAKYDHACNFKGTIVDFMERFG